MRDAPTSIDFDSLPAELRTLVDDELDPGERLLWVDQPNPRAASRGSWVIQLFGLPFTAFAVFWIAMAAGMGGGFFALFGVPFVLVGLGMLTAPVWVRRNAGKTVYVVTDARAILFQKQWNGMSIRSFRPDQLGSIERRQHDDGTGDLIFTREVSRHGSHKDGPRVNEIGFRGVRNVKRVEDLIEALVERHE